ncbi:MAG: hypothetical protein ACOZAO_03775 [Patescibacteria group bacterium]
MNELQLSQKQAIEFARVVRQEKYGRQWRQGKENCFGLKIEEGTGRKYRDVVYVMHHRKGKLASRRLIVRVYADNKKAIACLDEESKK